MGLFDEDFLKNLDLDSLLFCKATLSGFIPGAKPDEPDESRMNQLTALMTGCGYWAERSTPIGFVVCSMLSKADSNGNPLFTVEDVLNPSKLKDAKREIFEEVIRDLDDVTKNSVANGNENHAKQVQKKLDIELVCGVKRLCHYCNSEMEKVLKGNDMRKLLSSPLVFASSLLPELTSNYRESNQAFMGRIAAIEETAPIGFGNETVKYADMGDGGIVPLQSYMEKIRSLSKTKDLQGDLRKNLIENYQLLSIKAKLNNPANLGWNLEKYKDAEERLNAGNVPFLMNDEEENYEDGHATKEFLKKFNTETNRIQENPVLMAGAVRKAIQGDYFRNITIGSSNLEGEILSFNYTLPTDQELIQAIVDYNPMVEIKGLKTSSEWKAKAEPAALNIPADQNRDQIERIYKPLHDKLKKCAESMNKLDEMPQDSYEGLMSRKKVLEDVDKEVTKLYKKWDKNTHVPVVTKNNSSLCNFQNELKIQINLHNDYINAIKAGGRLPARTGDTANSPMAHQARKEQLQSCLAELNKQESKLKTSVHWKRMMSALELAIESNVEDPKNRSMVMLDESLKLVQKMTVAYLNHKASDGDDYKDFKKISAAKRLQSVVLRERELTEKAVKELMTSKNPEIDNPVSASLLLSKQKLFEALKNELSETKRTMDGTSPEFTRMITAFSELSKCCGTCKEKIVNPEGNHKLPEEDKLEYARKVKAALEKAKDYLKHKEAANNGSKTSLKRMMLVGSAYRYLNGLNAFATKVLDAEAEKKAAETLHNDERHSVLRDALLEGVQIREEEKGIKNIEKLRKMTDEATNGLAQVYKKAKIELEKQRTAPEAQAGHGYDVKGMLNGPTVKNWLKTVYANEIVKRQIDTAMHDKNVHDETLLLSQPMPAAYTAVKDGNINALLAKIGKNDTKFKEQYDKDITLEKIEQVITEQALTKLAQDVVTQNNGDPKFEPALVLS